MSLRRSRFAHRAHHGMAVLCSAAMLVFNQGCTSPEPPPAPPPPTPTGPATAPKATTKTSTKTTTTTTTTSAAPTSPAPAPTTASASATASADGKLPGERLDALVAPIALYPDNLLAQTLVASTYPLEIVALQQWLVKNKDLKGKALTDAVAKQPWDPAIQGMAQLPDLAKRLADDIQWTTELGNAFLAQQSDVMDAVQRMRKKAQDKGALATNEQQKVETKVVEEKTVIVVEQANPEVIYVPSYNPTVVYGPPPAYYPYPPVYYPPPPAYGFVSFSMGVMVGAAVWGGGCGWGGNDVYVDVDRNFNQNNINNINSGNRGNNNRAGGGNNKWSHNPQHRGAAPYSDQRTADKFAGADRGTGNRPSASQQSFGGSNRSASNTAANRSTGGGTRGSTASPSPTGRSSGGGNNIGSRNVSQTSSSRSSGFGGGSGGYSGSSARASSSRGSSSLGGSRGGGGFSRGGGGGRRR